MRKKYINKILLGILEDHYNYFWLCQAFIIHFYFDIYVLTMRVIHRKRAILDVTFLIFDEKLEKLKNE